MQLSYLKLYNKLVNFFAVIILITFTLINQVLALDNKIQEYGIVIFPEESCIKEAEKLNIYIAQILSKLENIENHWHVTLYHGAYDTNDLNEIVNKLKELELKPLTLNFVKFYSTSDRWIDWGIEKNDYLLKLHSTIVSLGSHYHRRPLARSKDIYKDMTDNQREQVDKYGVSGILTSYNPHMTLFYQYPPNSELQHAATKIINNFKENVVCKASKLVLGELGYNGNIKKIVYSIDIPS